MATKVMSFLKNATPKTRDKDKGWDKDKRKKDKARGRTFSPSSGVPRSAYISSCECHDSCHLAPSTALVCLSARLWLQIGLPSNSARLSPPPKRSSLPCLHTLTTVAPTVPPKPPSDDPPVPARAPAWVDRTPPLVSSAAPPLFADLRQTTTYPSAQDKGES